jgi:hypothetical protein
LFLDHFFQKSNDALMLFFFKAKQFKYKKISITLYFSIDNLNNLATIMTNNKTLQKMI